MLIHPQIDPVIFSIGPVSVRWYGLMYLIGFGLFMWLGRVHARRRPEMGWKPQDIDDLLFYGVIALVIGARLGEVLFFQPGYYFSHPGDIIKIWEGGLSFHGGFLGVLVAVVVYSWRHRRHFWDVTDFIAPLIPLGLACGRIGNFINGELVGRPASADLPWAMVYPFVDDLPRHPSQLYQATGEGMLLFVLLWLFSAKHRPRRAVSALFLIGYGVFRFIAEFFRTPDAGIFDWIPLDLTTAQWLCIMMIVAGVVLMPWKKMGDSR